MQKAAFFKVLSLMCCKTVDLLEAASAAFAKRNPTEILLAFVIREGQSALVNWVLLQNSKTFISGERSLLSFCVLSS